MVKGPEHNNLEGVEKIKPGSKASTVSTKPFIDNVHDRSENEKDTDTKFSAENALYERGSYLQYHTYIVFVLFSIITKFTLP